MWPWKKKKEVAQEKPQPSDATGGSRISPDSAVTDPGNDLLGHAHFAKALATSISKMSPVEGLVMALHGPWGSGKTTILNLVEYYLKQESEATRLIIIKFTPWWFSGQQDLTQRFFDQLAGHLKEDNHVSSETLDHLSEFMEAISDLPVDIPILSKVLRSGGKIVRALTEARQKDLTKLKKRLENALQKLGRKIIVFIDDIDRLTVDELRQMFGLVKAVANFPNTIYLLAFDRDVALKALEPLQNVQKGKDYLEKIIQVSWDIPPPEDYMLPTILLQYINLAAEGTPADLLDQNDFWNMFALLRNFLRTPRDCNRIGNALLAAYPSVRGEVNFPDFLAMEVVRLCLPGLHELIRLNPDRFAGIVSKSSLQSQSKELQEFHDRWLNDSAVIPPDLKDVAQNVMSRLFPKLQGVWSNYQYGPDFLARWQRECRASSPEILPTYFRLAVPLRSISRQRMKAIIEKCSDLDSLGGELSALAQEMMPDGRTGIAVFLERAQNLADQLNLEGSDLINLLVAILNDKFVGIADASPAIGLRIDNSWRIIWLVTALLQRFGAEERASYLKSAIVKASGLSAVVSLVATLEGEHDPKARLNAIRETVLPENSCKELTAIAADRIARAAQDGLLAKTPRLGRVLWVWKQWKAEDAKTWVNQFVAKDEGLLRLIDASTGEGQQSSLQDPIAQTFLHVDVPGLSEWIDLPTFRDRFEALPSSGEITEKQRFALIQILKYLESAKPTIPMSEMPSSSSANPSS